VTNGERSQGVFEGEVVGLKRRKKMKERNKVCVSRLDHREMKKLEV